MAARAGTLKSWPPIVLDILLDAARYYYREMNEPWPVPEVIMDRAMQWAGRAMELRQDDIYEDAPARWIDRWEAGELDDEMRRAIEDTYRRLTLAESALRPTRAGRRRRE